MENLVARLLRLKATRRSLFTSKRTPSFYVLMVLVMTTQFIFPVSFLYIALIDGRIPSTTLLTEIYLIGIIWLLLDYFVIWVPSRNMEGKSLLALMAMIGIPQLIFGSLFPGVALVAYSLYGLKKNFTWSTFLRYLVDISPSLILSGVALLFLGTNTSIAISNSYAFIPIVLGLALQVLSMVYMLKSPARNFRRLRGRTVRTLTLFCSLALAVLLLLLNFKIMSRSWTLEVELTFVFLLTMSILVSFYDVSNYLRGNEENAQKAFQNGFAAGRSEAWIEASYHYGDEMKARFESGRMSGYESGKNEVQQDLLKRIRELQWELENYGENSNVKANMCLDLFRLEEPTVRDRARPDFWTSFDQKVKREFHALAKITHPDQSQTDKSSGLFRTLNDCKDFLLSQEYKEYF